MADRYVPDPQARWFLENADAVDPNLPYFSPESQRILDRTVRASLGAATGAGDRAPAAASPSGGVPVIDRGSVGVPEADLADIMRVIADLRAAGELHLAEEITRAAIQLGASDALAVLGPRSGYGAGTSLNWGAYGEGGGVRIDSSELLGEGGGPRRNPPPATPFPYINPWGPEHQNRAPGVVPLPPPYSYFDDKRWTWERPENEGEEDTTRNEPSEPAEPAWNDPTTPKAASGQPDPARNENRTQEPGPAQPSRNRSADPNAPDGDDASAPGGAAELLAGIVSRYPGLGRLLSGRYVSVHRGGETPGANFGPEDARRSQQVLRPPRIGWADEPDRTRTAYSPATVSRRVRFVPGGGGDPPHD